MDCFERFSIELRPLILWLTSSFAESYDNVATYEFKKSNESSNPNLFATQSGLQRILAFYCTDTRETCPTDLFRISIVAMT
jgi:hypothetical protein